MIADFLSDDQHRRVDISRYKIGHGAGIDNPQVLGALDPAFGIQRRIVARTVQDG